MKIHSDFQEDFLAHLRFGLEAHLVAEPVTIRMVLASSGGEP